MGDKNRDLEDVEVSEGNGLNLFDDLMFRFYVLFPLQTAYIPDSSCDGVWNIS